MRIVVKVGTSTLAHPTGRLNIQRMERLCKVLSDLKNAGHEIILVSSGAIGMGVGKLSLPSKPSDMPTKQAAAAVGQCELMYIYDKLFTEYNHIVAQILITAPDLQEAGASVISTTRSQGFWSSARFRSSTKMTPSPRTKSSSATMTRCRQMSRPPSAQTFWSCFPISTDFMTATPTKTRRRG